VLDGPVGVAERIGNRLERHGQPGCPQRLTATV
jgi:hypothetical protein